MTFVPTAGMCYSVHSWLNKVKHFKTIKCEQMVLVFRNLWEFIAKNWPKDAKLTKLLKLTTKRLCYVCNPRSLKEGTETSRRRTDELGYRLERPIHFECKLNEPIHIGMRLLHPAAADHSVSINRQQVQRIFRFSLRSRAGARPLSGGTGAVATGRDVSVPSFRERGLHT